jgi:origin recognition complex subunit 4
LYADEEFKQHLESYFYSSKSVPAFLVSCILPLSSLSPASARLVFSTPPSACSLGPPDSKLHLLSSLSDLELSLLISAARLDITAHTDTVNFAMAYDEYVSLMGRQRLHSASAGMLALGGGSKVWGRGVAGMAWERLAGLGLLLPAAFGARTAAGGGGGGALAGGQAGGSESKMWKLEVALEEIPGAVKLASVMAKWCREI